MDEDSSLRKIFCNATKAMGKKKLCKVYVQQTRCRFSVSTNKRNPKSVQIHDIPKDATKYL